MSHYDVVIIGGGIAGASVAANLAVRLKVLVLEREDQPGYHSTGRSAALFSEIYGSATIRALSRASRDFLFNPPSGFADVPLVSPRGVLFIANVDQVGELEEFANLPDIECGTRRVSSHDALAITPCLRREYVAAALYEPDARDINVHDLHIGYLRVLRKQGGRVICDAKVTALSRHGEIWEIISSAGVFTATTIVNAAGAWVDQIAEMAGAKAIGIRPLKRSVCIAETPIGVDAEHWPLTIDIGEKFYFKPDAGSLLISPADEAPSAPCDAWPEDIDIAVAIDRISHATTLDIQRVKNSWAGLRNFVADRNPVVGYDPQVSGLFWIAALGGYGIQTAPAMGRLAAALLQNLDVPSDMLILGLDTMKISPARFM